MKKYTTPEVTLGMLDTTDVISTSAPAVKEFIGLNMSGSTYMGDELDIGDLF